MKKISTFILAAVVIHSGLQALAQEPHSGAANASQSAAGAQHFVYQDQARRDPFAPLLDADGNMVLYDNELILTDLTLEGTMVGSKVEASIAIINGRIIKIHDRIGPFQVEMILKDRVVLKKDQETVQLKLKKE